MAISFLWFGFTHVLPFGFDHLLFILCLFFSGTNLKSLLLKCTAFTLAHSLTLFLAVFQLIQVSSSLIEPLIAVTILVMAVENILVEKPRKYDVLLVGFFGLIHGLGFASALISEQILPSQLVGGLFAFNSGVEIAQVIVILVAWLCIRIPLHNKNWYRTTIVMPASTLTAIVALYLLISRLPW